MRAVLDATPLGGPVGGIRRYVAELSLALTRTFGEDRFILVSDQPFDPVEGVCWYEARPRGLARRWWAWGLPRALARLHADVFHGTDFAVPYVPLRPSVLTLHDLSPWTGAAWRAASERVRRRTPVLLGLGLATMVITPTEAVRRAAIARFGLHPSRVAAVPHGASSLFRPACPPASRRAPYFLHVGALEPRKNIGLLIAAWREVRKCFEVELVLAGRPREGFPTPPPEPGLVVPGEVPERDLPELYSGALACLCASHYEGFGLPALEAMQCGAAVIASNDPAIREVTGDAALLLDIADSRAWAEAMAAAAGNASWRSERRARSLERASGFSWTEAARHTREVYAEAIRRFGR